MDLKNMQNVSEAFIEKFKDLATELVMSEAKDNDEETIKNIVKSTARAMAIGAKIKQNEHIAIGISIGVGLTCLTFGMTNKVMSRKSKDIVIYDMDNNELHIKKKDIDEAFEEVSVSDSEVIDIEIELEENEEKGDILDRINDILKKPQNLDDLKAVIKELRDNEKK